MRLMRLRFHVNSPVLSKKQARLHTLDAHHPLSIHVKSELDRLSPSVRMNALRSILQQLNRPEYRFNPKMKGSILAETALYAAINLGVEHNDMQLAVAREAIDKFDTVASVYSHIRFNNQTYDAIFTARSILDRVQDVG